jgi:hypothetical protein
MSNYDLGGVDLFGLDEFGQPVGGLSVYGGLIGGVTQTAASMLFRRVTTNATMNKFSEGLGGVVGAALGAGLWFMGPDYRAAAFSAGLTALVTGALRQAEVSLLPVPTAAAGAWGMTSIDPQYMVPGSGGMSGYSLGLATVEPSASLRGLQGPPQLVGAGNYGLGDNPGAQQVQLQGGPAISGLGAHFGATLFS